MTVRELDAIGVSLSARETPQELVCRAYEAERLTVYRYLASLGVDPATAQDLTQEVFLNLYRAVRRGEQIQTLRAWLFTAASRLALNHARARTYRPPAGADGAAALDRLIDPAAGPEHALLRQERVRVLREAFQTLSPQQQVCLHLRAEGLRYREIAKVLGVRVPTVSEFLRRAIGRLRRTLDE